MRSILFCGVVLFLMASTVYAQPATGPVAHWNFNGNANDISGNGHHGTIHNVTLAPGASGVSNTAYAFAGDPSSYISVPYATDLSLDSFTICALVKLNGFYTDLCQISTIVTKGGENTAGNYNLQFFDNAFDSSCVITGDTSKFVFISESYGNWAYHKSLQYTPTTHTGNWYCIIATYNGSVYKTYVNGTLMCTAYPYVHYGHSTNNDGLAIGCNTWSTQYPYWFKGIMDDLCIYGRAFTDSEVSSYCSESPSDTIINSETASINDDDDLLSISLSPNPNTGNFTLSGTINSNNDPITISVINLMGQTVYSAGVFTQKNKLDQKITLDNNIATGLYIMQIKTGKKSTMLKFILQR